MLQDSAHVAASREAVFRIPREGPGSFLRHVIKPFYNVAMAVSERPYSTLTAEESLEYLHAVGN